ncbi:hypothetical protein [Maribacter sp. HTCC2170]|uniref:hypothetical protein n=1 Tax=Maribacter sp. (strain HTCC2170 / KCCM 42371) TaxID=313603 RepID=UPI0002F72B3E|nr:hypothetical protein [Maribacter sp. HTCC2170]
MIVTLITVGVYGQKQSKTFNEVFNVNAETVLDINTSNADIEFETWDKNQIAIEAIIELEGASAEEAADYFKNGGIEIIGNSKKIKIITGTENSWLFNHSTEGLHNLNIDIPNFHFEMPELPEMPEMAEMPEFHMEDFHIDLSDMPMPPVPAVEFDYEAYKKDGEKYLRKWQKKFDKGFDKEYQKKMEAWSAKMDIKRKVMEERREELEQKHEKRMQKRLEAQERRMEEQAEAMEKRAEAMEKRAVEMEKKREKLFEERRNNETDSNIFYYSSEGENKKYEVKKTIKIKMPKGTKIKMNVRHGEVKLAGNTKNINARLSYSTLLAATIDGDETIIKTSYSPVSVQKWNYGLLQADYSENVDLNEVLNLRLSTTSSDVTINRLLESVIINNKMGPLTINSISSSFKEMDVSLQNAEMTCPLPKTDFVIEVNGTLSKLTAPASLKLDRTKHNNTTIHTGYNKNSKSDKSVVINSKYSEVVLKE